MNVVQLTLFDMAQRVKRVATKAAKNEFFNVDAVEDWLTGWKKTRSDSMRKNNSYQAIVYRIPKIKK